MIIKDTILVINSWELRTIGIIAELNHELNGLPADSILKSTSTGNKWRVLNRVLFNNSIDEQKKLSNETITHLHLSFGNIENMEASKEQILEKEKQNTFQYQLEAIGSHSKPEQNDVLMFSFGNQVDCYSI